MLALPAAWSQQKQGDGQVRALQQRLRAAEQEKSQLAAESAALDKKAKDLEARLAQSRRAAEAAERQRIALAKDLEAATSEKSALTEQVAQSQRDLAELRSQLSTVQVSLDRTQGLLSRSEMQRQQQERSLAERVAALAECTTRNDDLYQTAAGLLADLGVQGLGRPAEGEPLTRLARVAVENKMEEYRERMDRGQFGPALQRRHEAEQRQAAQRRMAAEAAEQARLEQAKDERLKAARERARQQSDLDKLTRRIRNFFDGIEW
ncbi:MAG: hypothetical protein ACOYLV_10790 [Rubrivivax sp.]